MTELPGVRLGGRVMGPGRPVLAVPLQAAGRDELVARGRAAVESGVVDLVEWRTDALVPELLAPAVLRELADALTATLAGLPVLLTHRSVAQGGRAPDEPTAARALRQQDAATQEQVVAALAGHPGIALVDVELDHPRRSDLLATLRAAGTPVLLSHHDWTGQPPRAELVETIGEMRSAGGDAVKIAVTPTTRREALTLLELLEAETAQPLPEDPREGPRIPLAVLGMGSQGRITRLVGPAFGSCLTFGHLGRASAPGQVEAAQLAAVLSTTVEAT